MSVPTNEVDWKTQFKALKEAGDAFIAEPTSKSLADRYGAVGLATIAAVRGSMDESFIINKPVNENLEALTTQIKAVTNQ